MAYVYLGMAGEKSRGATRAEIPYALAIIGNQLEITAKAGNQLEITEIRKSRTPRRPVSYPSGKINI